MTETPRRRPGRPSGTFRTIYDKPRAFRLTTADLARLKRLAEQEETSESEIVRRLIRQAAEERP